MYLGNWNAFIPYQFNIEGLKESLVGPCSWEITATPLNLGSPIEAQITLSQTAGTGSAQISVGFITTYQEPGLYNYRITVSDTTNGIVAGEKTINITVKPPRTAILNVPQDYTKITEAVL